MKNNKVVFTAINGKKYGLLYSVAATRRIGEISGFKSSLEWIGQTAETVQNAENDVEKITATEELAYRICIILEALVNAYADYCKAVGEKAESVPEDYFINTMGTADALKLQECITTAIYKGMNIEIPKSLAKDIDEDYIEIEAAKKN